MNVFWVLARWLLISIWLSTGHQKAQGSVKWRKGWKFSPNFTIPWTGERLKRKMISSSHWYNQSHVYKKTSVKHLKRWVAEALPLGSWICGGTHALLPCLFVCIASIWTSSGFSAVAFRGSGVPYFPAFQPEAQVQDPGLAIGDWSGTSLMGHTVGSPGRWRQNWVNIRDT